ncbi:MAG: ABC transporter permease [Oscillospiraceae bacterium]|jgi:oligopeptide transport system permease protein|nr:ABC transporter permease [Oscillospiraceae bacterium]MDE6996613.1 ABC transporter permease [Oscillospiraceae bacterium]
MFKYTVKRLLQSLLTVLIVVTVVFLLMRLLPNDNYFTEDQQMKLNIEERTELLRQAGLLDPIPIQLFRYYGQLLRLDFGTSRRIQTGVAVMKIIESKFTVSMRLGLTSMAISLVIGVLLGVLQARRKDRLPDHIVTAYTIFVNSVPHLVSYSLILVFGARVLQLPSMYSTRNVGKSIILPIACLAMGSIAHYALWTRRYMVDESTKDYIKLARIKGMAQKDIMLKHVLKNAFVPLVQYIPASIIMTVGGSLLVERFFSVPGMGTLMTDAINRYDTEVVQTCVMIYAALGIIGVFLGDIAMMIVDPRIKLAGGGETR